MNSEAQVGFNWFLEVVRADGRVEREQIHNLVPLEGLSHMMATEYKAGAQVTQWWVSLFEGNYTPQPALTAATYPAVAVECTAYNGASRKEFVTGPVSNGSVDNSASKAAFEFNDTKTVYGGVITSSSPKGSVNGVIGSAVRFPSPKLMQPGDTLNVIASNSLISAA